MWYRFAASNNDKEIIKQSLGPNPETFLNTLSDVVDKAQKGFALQNISENREAFQALSKMQQILKKHPDFLDKVDKIFPRKYSKLRNLNQLTKSTFDWLAQGNKITKGFGAASKASGKVAEFFQKSLKVLKPLGYISLFTKVALALEKLSNNEELDAVNTAELVSALIQIPQVAALAGPYAPALLTAGFIADTVGIDAATHAGKLSSGIGLDEQYQNELEQKSNQANMGNRQRKMLSETSQELSRLIAKGISPEEANKIVKNKFKEYFDEAIQIYQNNKKFTDNLNTAVNLTFIPQYNENLRYFKEKYDKKNPKKQPIQKYPQNTILPQNKPVLQQQNVSKTPSPSQYLIN